MSESLIILIYSLVHVGAAVMDIALAYKAYGYRKKIRGSNALCGVCIWAAVVTLTYLASVTAEGELPAKIASSLHFASIDLLLYTFMHYACHLTERRLTRGERVFDDAVTAYGIFDFLMLLINPLTEWALSYTQETGVPVAHYAYHFKPLYYGHLAYSYLLIFTILYVVIEKILKTPRQYRNQYTYFLLALVVIVGVNALYLFLPVDGVLGRLDYSILGYSLGLGIVYWSRYQYTHTVMLEKLSLGMVSRIDLAIVLFDNNGYLVMENPRAVELFGDLEAAKRMDMRTFIQICNMPAGAKKNSDQYTLQCNIRKKGGEQVVSCQYYRLREDRGAILGHVFLFDERAEDMDPLTGFLSWTAYEKYINGHADSQLVGEDFAVAVFDINGLEQINEKEGHAAGDAKLVALAGLIRERMPDASYYVRGRNAHLIVLSYATAESDMVAFARQIQELYADGLQFGAAAVNPLGHQGDILDAVAQAEKSMRNKKLIDLGSMHSQMISSLVRALQECDSDTEAHVKRTQRMGDALGVRLGLSDLERSQLSLLCLLHDIGKIGVPLEILNKPGKLTSEEWKVLQSHTVKGYEIAKSSLETEDIADMILHHHERWDAEGYPSRIGGRAIPLLSRIISVVDSYDAMVNDRSYRKAMTREKAVAELDRCAGSQFDPNLVAEFKQVLKEHPEFSEMMVRGTTIEAGPAMVSAEAVSPAGEMHLTNMTHVMKYGIYILDNKDYFVSGDRNFEELTGYQSQTLVDRRMMQLDFIPREDQEEYVRLTAQQLQKGTKADLKHRFIKADGSLMTVLCYGRRYYDSSVKEMRTEILITVLDLPGDEKKAEEE